MFINLYIDLYGVAVRDLYRLVATYIVVLEGGYCTWSKLSLVVSLGFAFLLVQAKLFTIPAGHFCEIWQRLVYVVGLATLFLNVDLCKCCSRFCIDNVYYDNIIPHRCYIIDFNVRSTYVCTMIQLFIRRGMVILASCIICCFSAPSPDFQPFWNQSGISSQSPQQYKAIKVALYRIVTQQRAIQLIILSEHDSIQVV